MRALLTALVLLALAGQSARAQAAQPVVELSVDGDITRATDMYLEEGLRAAEARGAQAVILKLNTPGGGLAETFSITERIGNSAIPVVGYVAPRTANAWSAGTIILLSTHVAAMAPFSVIGSSQPVELGAGGFTPINDTKVINAIVGKLKALAAAHGRNESAAEAFVTQNLNLDAQHALDARVVEVVAGDEQDLLRQLDGRTIATANGNVTLHTAGAPIEPVNPGLRTELIALFSDPLLSGLLLLVGIYALIFGLGAPGHGAEVAGVVLILLALGGMGFNVSLVALALIALGAILLLAELHHGFGVLGAAGIACIILGTLFLAPLSPTGPAQWSFPAQYQAQVLLILALPSLLLAGFLVFALLKVQQARRRKPAISTEVVGLEAHVTAPVGPGKQGFVTFRGEEWQAVSEWELQPGQRVVVRGKDGPVLRVEPTGGEPSSRPGA
ncbi:MAG: nodulation protein NfeD [Halobacteriales archaeon]|nr:nodulation protein NfeD [Halobacteriales archaeon]